jgi:glucose uptake protein
MVGALWGVFIWKEFKGATKAVNILLMLMFILFTAGLGMIIVAGTN